MSNSDKKKKRLVSISVRTAIDIIECEKVIKNCIERLDLSNVEIILDIESGNAVSVIDGTRVTLARVTCDSDGGWAHSGMKALCKCLEASGYFVQSIISAHSFIPVKE